MKQKQNAKGARGEVESLLGDIDPEAIVVVTVTYGPTLPPEDFAVGSRSFGSSVSPSERGPTTDPRDQVEYSRNDEERKNKAETQNQNKSVHEEVC